MRILLALFASLLFVAEAAAQPVLMVPYDKAAFHWDPPINPLPEGTGVTQWYEITCGPSVVRIDVPATSIPVKDVVSAVGSYTCSIVAGNDFGRSTSVAFPAFQAGYVPATPDNTRIEIQ